MRVLLSKFNVPRKASKAEISLAFRPTVRSGPYYGLMQILPCTARSMGFQGQLGDFLDAKTNLRHATRYLRGAWLVSGDNMDAAVMSYAHGYYFKAKRLGLIEETGVDGSKV